MGIINDVFEAALKKRGYTKQPNVGRVPSSIFDIGLGGDKKTSDYLASYTGWVYGAVKRRAEQMSGMDVKLMRQSQDGAVEVDMHPAIDRLRHVNETMTMRELLEITHVHLDLTGEAFWVLDREDGGKPRAITPIRPDRTQVVMAAEERGRVSGRMIEGYIYRRHNRDGTFEDIPLLPENVVPIREPHPMNPLRGLGIVEASALTIDNDDAQEKWSFKFFEQGATVKPAFQTDQFLDEDSLKTLYTELRKNWAGIDNAHSPVILHSGLKSADVNMNMKDMEFLKGQKWTRDKILGLAGVTKTMLGITEDVNRANAETNEFVFAKYMIKPRMEKLVDYMNRFYLPTFANTEDKFFMVDDPVPADADQQRQRFASALGGITWMTQNEVREEQGLSPVENGDTLYAPANMVPIDGKLQQQQEQRTFNTRHAQVKARQKRLELAEEQIESHVRPLAEKIVKQNTKATMQRTNELSRSAWKASHIKQSEKHEKTIKREVVDYMEQQQAKVVQQVQRIAPQLKFAVSEKQGVDDLLFDSAEFRTLGFEILKPLITDVIAERGQEAIFFIGARSLFDIDSAPVQDFIDNRATLAVKAINQTTREKLRKTLSAGVGAGEGIPDLTERVRSVYTSATDFRAETIARTETIQAQNFAARQAWKDAGVKTKQWLSVPDGRRDPMCEAMEGKRISIDAPFFEKDDEFSADDEDGKTHRTTFIDDVQEPPLHPNAVLEGTTFASYGNLDEMVGADYEGPAVLITTTEGHELTIGPNHPILTQRGMVRARDLAITDYLVYDRRFDDTSTISDSDLKDVPFVEDAFVSITKGGGLTRVATPANDLHGDRIFCKGKVNVVVPADGLLFKLDSGGVEKFREGNFMLPNMEAIGLPGLGSGNFGFDAIGLATPGGMGSGLSGYVFSHIQSIHYVDFKGKAFDATTETGIYNSNGFVVSNCRCTLIPVTGKHAPRTQVKTRKDMKAKKRQKKLQDRIKQLEQKYGQKDV